MVYSSIMILCYNLNMEFQKTIGHEKQKRLFARVYERERVGHVYAFVGEEGVGKTTFAREMAVWFGADPILDLLELGEDIPISVDDTRTLQSRLALTPTGQYKAAIIQADSMGREAANALLKTLEEPPAHSIIFLIVSNFYNLLPTIISRVQKIVFGRSTDEQVRTALARLNLEQNRQAEIVQLASGRIGLALRLATDSHFFEFARACLLDYQNLDLPGLAARLKIAEHLAALETMEIKYFLRSALRAFATEPKSLALGRKLATALADLDANVNVKLALDNLCI